MLSFEPNIKTLREVCKRLTGRTSATAVARINRYLAALRPEYYVEVSTQAGPVRRGTRLSAITPLRLRFTAQRPNGPVIAGPTEVSLPTSLTDLLNTLIQVDRAAEGALGLNYGGTARAPRGLVRAGRGLTFTPSDLPENF